MENWQKTYDKEIGIYDAFSQYEDEGNKLLKRLLRVFSFRGKKVLEIGCGSGKYTKLLASMAKEYFALEISRPLIQLAKQRCKGASNIRFLHCSAERIPLENDSVDVVFASWVLTAITSMKVRNQSIKEILRVLKSGGDVWLFENHWQGEFMKMRGKSGLRFKESDVYQLVKKYGFDIATTVDTNFSFPDLLTAKQVLGFIFGDKALNYLSKNPDLKLKHRVVILHKVKPK